MPERVDDEDARETSEATSLDTELPLLERKARREGKGIQKAMRKDESSDAGFMVVSGEEDAKGETGDGFVGPVRDSIVPESVYHGDKDDDATSEAASPDSELPLLERKARREAKEKGKAVSQDETSDSELMDTPSEDTSSAKAKNTHTPTKKGSGKKSSKDRLRDTPETVDED